MIGVQLQPTSVPLLERVKDLLCNPRYNGTSASVRDLFEQRDLGEVRSGGTISVAVPFHDVVMLRLAPPTPIKTEDSQISQKKPHLNGIFLSLDEGNAKLSAEQWRQEFEAMKAVKIEFFAIRSVLSARNSYITVAASSAISRPSTTRRCCHPAATPRSAALLLAALSASSSSRRRQSASKFTSAV